MSYSRDSISSLPDEILGKILSLLPTKVAASTSILSKRWENLLVCVDSLCFDESMVVYPNEEEATRGSHRFLDFVDKTFALLSNSPIIKFSLSRVHGRDGKCEFNRVNRCVNRWIRTAMERGLLELHLHANLHSNSSVAIETELLTSKTLVKLTLSGEYYLEVKRVFFPALKSLSLLSGLGFGYDDLCLLLDGCPVLEDLFITDVDHSNMLPCFSTAVESESIKRLVVIFDHPRIEDHDAMFFNAPSLVYLDYSSHVFQTHQLVDLDMLVEARLNLRLWESTSDYDYSDDDDDDDDHRYCSDDDDDDHKVEIEIIAMDEGEGPKAAFFGDVTNLVAGISNITTLHLSPDTLEALSEKGWQVMPLLLKNCPNLHTLVIKGLVHRVTNRCGDACACIPKKPRKIVKEEEELCCLWTCQVKVLEILEYGGSFQELKQMIHFLGKLECLETVKIGVDADNDNNAKFLRANLLTLPRLSSKCTIQFI